MGALRCERLELRQRREYWTELCPLSADDVGSRVQLLVTAVNGGGVASASSQLSPVVIVPPAPGVSSGLPPTVVNAPAGVTRGETGAPKLLMGIRIVRVVRKGGRVVVTVGFVRGSGRLSAAAVEVGQRGITRLLHRRLTGHRKNASTMTFAGRLSLGRWVLSIIGRPAHDNTSLLCTPDLLMVLRARRRGPGLCGAEERAAVVSVARQEHRAARARRAA